MKRVWWLVVGVFLVSASTARAETGTERFRSLLTISGYSTIIGAAVGAALLAFTKNPGDNLDYVARGAAIGFLGGAAVGSFLVFSPLFIDEPWSYRTSPLRSLALVPDPALAEARLTLSPIINRRGVQAVAIRASLLQF